MSDIYYDPAKFGLETVGEVEFSSGAYEFDTSVVWRDTETGTVFVGHDSGCSCPSPFESIGRDDLTKVNRLQGLVDYFDQRKADSYDYNPTEYPDRAAIIDGEIGQIIAKVAAL